MAIVVILILVGGVIGLYFLNKKTGILRNFMRPRQKTLDELKKEAEEMEKKAAEYDRRAEYALSIQKSRKKIAEAKAKMNPPGKSLFR